MEPTSTTSDTTGADDPLEVWSTYKLRTNPYPAYAALRAPGPVHRAATPEGRICWFVIGYETARQALTDPRITRQADRVPARYGATDPLVARGLGASMMAVDPPDHTRLRGLMASAFTSRRIELLRPFIQQVTDRLLDQIAGRDRIDLYETFAFPLPVLVMCELLGVPFSDRDRFRGLMRQLFAPGEPGRPAHQTASVQDAGHALLAYLAEIIAAKRAHPTDDLTSALIAARDGDGALTEQELLSGVAQLLVAGHETTVNLLIAGMSALLRHPDQAAFLRSQPDQIPTAVEELLRYDGPTEMAVARWALEDLTLAGTTIPEGACIMVVLGAADRDPARFPEPDQLDIQRPALNHLAFGHGVHYCLGAPLTRLEARIALRELLLRFPRMGLIDPDGPQVLPNLSLRMYTTLPVTLN